MVRFFQILTRNLTYLLTGPGIGFVDKVRLKITARYKHMNISFFGKIMQVTDSSSFVANYEEIFIKKIYAFKATTPSPYIIDCGANAGVSVLYFKHLYPESRIVAFEPDDVHFAVLENNIRNSRFENVELRKEAVWTSAEELSFLSVGALSGFVVDSGAEGKVLKVKGFRLKDLLTNEVDFLKIDIEGAEYDVLKDCKDVLKNVKNLFVEYHSTAGEEQKLDEVLSIFKAAGFRYQVHEAFTSPHPYLEIRQMLQFDLQLNIFCYR